MTDSANIAVYRALARATGRRIWLSQDGVLEASFHILKAQCRHLGPERKISFRIAELLCCKGTA